jgi:hypothetical protein
MIAEIQRKPIACPVKIEAPLRDPVGIRDQRKTRRGERIVGAGGRAPKQVGAVQRQMQQRPADRGRERCLQRPRPQDDDLLAQPTISSSSRPLVSLTMARTKKKEMAANTA